MAVLNRKKGCLGNLKRSLASNCSCLYDIYRLPMAPCWNIQWSCQSVEKSGERHGWTGDYNHLSHRIYFFSRHLAGRYGYFLPGHAILEGEGEGWGAFLSVVYNKSSYREVWIIWELLLRIICSVDDLMALPEKNILRAKLKRKKGLSGVQLFQTSVP